MGRKKKRKKINADRTSGNQKIAVIWTRVSTSYQAENNLSLETQEKACREYAERNGIEIDRIMGQTNESAKVEGKLYEEMITYVSMNKRINIILVYSYDRFSRAGAEAIVTKAFLKTKGISVISVTQPIDSDNMAGEFMENMLFLFNQFENNLRKQKCTAGMLQCLEKGDWFSKPPLGYEPDRTTSAKHRYIINDKGRLIEQAFKWKAEESVSDVEILERLKVRGLRLDKQRLSDIFHNPFYCGKIKHYLLGDRIVPGNQPAIIDEYTWNIVNGIDTHSGYVHQEETPETPLKQHLVCPCCGKHLSGYVVKAKGLWYYKCSTKGCKLNKSAKVVHEEYEKLLDQYKMPEVVQTIAEETIKSILMKRNIQVEEDLAELKKRRTTLKHQRSNVMMRYGTGQIPKDVYELTKKNLDKEIDDLSVQVLKLEDNSSNHVTEVNRVILTACKLKTLWKNGSYKNRQNLQKLVFPDGLIWDKETDKPRTIRENEAFKFMRSLSSTYEKWSKEKTGKSFDFSGLVAEAGLEPTTSGL